LHITLSAALVLALLAPALAAGEETVTETRVVAPIALERASNPKIRIDGVLDEPVWATLPVYGEFRILEPDTLEAPAHETRVKIFYTSKGLYVAFDMDQPKHTLLARLSGRDAFQVSRDEVSFTVDTSGEGRYGYWFGVGLGGSLSDGTVLPERQYSNNWDGAWRGASSTTKKGWSAELFVPWGTVSMPVTGSVRQMGLYMSRRVAYLDERWGWPTLPFTKPKFMSALQPLAIEGVAPRQQYSLYPFTATNWDNVDNEMIYKVGTDIFWRPTTNAQVTATVNPDFGVVESDDVVVNLTATETFFPEKRLFFLEGQEIFVATPRAEPRTRGEIGNTGSPYTMVNTRRIGGPPREPALAPGTSIEDRELNQLIDLYGAAKVTGQSGQLRYGVLGASEQDIKFDVVQNGRDRNLNEPGDDYGIVRVLYEDAPGGAYRSFGVLSTAVMNPDRNAFAQGIDGHYLSARGKLKIDGQMFTSDIDEIDRGYGGFVDFDYYIRQGVTQRLGIEYFDQRIDINDLGYLERNDSFRIRSSHQRSTPNLGWAHDNQFDARGFVSQNHENKFTGGAIFVSNRLTFNDLSRLTTRAGFLPKSYDDINGEGNGTYRIDEHTQESIRWDSDTTQRWSVGIGAGHMEEFLNGDTYTAEGQIDWRPSDRFFASLAVIYMDRGEWLLHQTGTRMATYDARQLQPKATIEYFITARQQLRASLQWVGIEAREEDVYFIPAQAGDLIPAQGPTGPPRDFSLTNMSFQLRYRWEIAPLSDVFVVWTILADDLARLGDSNFESLFGDAFNEPQNDFIVVKLRYRLGS
jgi:hypothetical protein